MTILFFFPVFHLVHTNVCEMLLFTYRDRILIKGLVIHMHDFQNYQEEEGWNAGSSKYRHAN